MPVELWSMGGSPPCRLVLLTAKMLGVDHKVTELDLMKGEQNTPEFIAVNPAHCVPTMRDGETTIWESRAIAQYLCNKYGPDSSLYPKCPCARATVDFLLYWDMGTLYKSIAEVVYGVVFRGEEKDEAKCKAFEEKCQFLEDHLIKGEFLTGDNVTIADLSIACSLTMPTLVGYSFEKYEKLNKLLKKVHDTKYWAEVTAPFEGWKASLKK
jgi:glutathione S-transferase